MLGTAPWHPIWLPGWRSSASNICSTYPVAIAADCLRELAENSRLKAIFTTYEMEAAYAADAYARIRGCGAMCGTYGVGALSALNGVVGAFVERCPVVVINGSPSAKQLDLEIEYGIMFLHSTGRLKTDLAIYSQVTVATAVINWWRKLQTRSMRF